mmetsp:Transcript_13433/g.18371  ORF Transcript_13433/g.18371 Transcript_13433/m.18371 type:complete len:492 (-) Transcript_13433:364-1839(-)|eukprot:CAMPEP_0196573700 /NCGR_PEP_ID=MMETSP1081-20130531/3566_1 /TAXON_ID=36882 /ORGANISM="Pyramimonas amylifera, Strain CCMP720" /LENGTH=491 /DNA_ID=CAMNT_0041891515 /DNA_START=536 /DNA_END=2011 /DNA_ORIENTATION=-
MSKSKLHNQHETTDLMLINAVPAVPAEAERTGEHDNPLQKLKLGKKELEASRRSPLITEVIFWSAQGHLEAVQHIVKSNDLDVTEESFCDYDKRTPLHLAAAEGAYRVCQWLLESKCNPNCVDRFLYTPLTGALQGKHSEVIQLLEKFGGKVFENDQLVPLAESELAGKDIQKRGGLSSMLMDDNWEIFESEVSMLRPHGSGAFGTVYQARWRGTIVAAKALKVDVLTDSAAMSEFKTELGLMQRLHHPHIIQFLGACTKTKKPILVTEFMWGNSLDKIFRDKVPLTPKQSIQYAMDIAKGLAYLHGRHPQPVIHRDLKPANIMLSGGVCKIGDFGLSRTLAPMRVKRPIGQQHADNASADMTELYVMTGETGSYRYMSPEVFRHESYNIKADCYAFAMIVYQMFELKQPFEGMDPIKAAAQAASNGLRPQFTTKRTPPAIKELITELWDAVAAKRPSFMEVLVRLDAVDRMRDMAEAKKKTKKTKTCSVA